MAITGKLKFSGLKPRTDAGGKMTLTFENGKKVVLTSLGVQRRRWDVSSDKRMQGEVFAMEKDPGRLLNRNLLCGDLPARYVVFYDETDIFGEVYLGLSVFSSPAPPADGQGQDLCGTYNYLR